MPFTKNGAPHPPPKMKKQINPTIKAHLIRGAFYLLLLVAVCAIPFALAQRTTKRTTAKPSVVRQGMAANRAAGGPKVLPPATGAVSAALGVQRNTATDQSLLPYDFPPKVPQVGPPRTSSGMTRAHAVSCFLCTSSAAHCSSTRLIASSLQSDSSERVRGEPKHSESG